MTTKRNGNGSGRGSGRGKVPLTPDPRNARIHGERNKQLIKESLEAVGPLRSIGVDGNNVIRAGNGVYDQAQALGLKVRIVDAAPDELIAVRRPDLKGKRAIKAALYDNRAGEVESTWNTDVLAEIAARDGDLVRRMFEDDREILAAIGPQEQADAEPQVDRAEELLEKWQVKTGDLWRIGEHRLLCGDSLVIENVKNVLSGDKPSMIVADPPYGINIVAADGYVGGGEKYDIPFGGVKRKGYVGGENRIKARTGHYPIESWKPKNRLGSAHAAKPFGSQKQKSVRGSIGAAHVVDVGKYSEVVGDDTTETAIKSSALLLSEYGDAVHVWWGANYYADNLSPSSCWIVWDKETTGNFADCELAWTNQDRAAKLFRHRWNGMLRDSERERRWHPTQKPAALAAWLSLEFTKQGAIILDPFCGAGWSMIGAENSRRIGRAIEISPAYCAVTLERMATAFPGIEIERIDNGNTQKHKARARKRATQAAATR